jgi:hypothetical protein
VPQKQGWNDLETHKKINGVIWKHTPKNKDEKKLMKGMVNYEQEGL